jgi:hypothetical protein
MTDLDTFETDNLYLGAFLMLKKIDKVGNSTDERGHVTFKFADVEVCNQLRAQYELSDVTISIPDYLMYLDRLRDIVNFGRPRRQRRL